MHRIARNIVAGVIAWSSIAQARGPLAPSAGQVEMQRIVESTDLTPARKVERLKGMLKDEGADALRYIHRVDPEAAIRVAVERINDPAVPRAEKVGIGAVMVGRDMGAADFIDAYAPVLVELVVHGGAAEMMQAKEMSTPTAVGQYVWIASDFGGFSAKDFTKVADKRVIPALIECLGAPDELNRADDHVFRGVPGAPSGRNTQRQQIPVALAKLGAVEATPAMVKVVQAHHDYWLRYHSAYAVGLLGNEQERGEVERFLVGKGADEERWMLFGFGHGLVQRGMGEGFKYFTFEHSTWSRTKDFYSAIYAAEERLKAAKGVKAKEAEAFYAHVLKYEPLRDAFLFDETKVVVPEHMLPKGGGVKEALGGQAKRVEKAYADLLEGIVLNGFTGLAAEIEAIGKGTKSDAIKRMSEEALAKLKK